MPQRPLQPCASPGCPYVTRGRYCERHRRTGQRYAVQPWSHVYKSQEWQKVRKQVLTEEPDCEECGAPANTVDHIIPLRTLWTPQGWKLSPYHRANLRPLCASCSGKRTAYGRTR